MFVFVLDGGEGVGREENGGGGDGEDDDDDDDEDEDDDEDDDGVGDNDAVTVLQTTQKHFMPQLASHAPTLPPHAARTRSSSSRRRAESTTCNARQPEGYQEAWRDRSAERSEGLVQYSLAKCCNFAASLTMAPMRLSS